MHTILIRGYCHDFTALHIQLLFKMYKMGTTLEQNLGRSERIVNVDCIG